MPLPTIPSGNVASATASTGYNVANSLRFENGSSQQLTRSIGSSPTNTKKGTISYWIKRTKLSTNDVIVSNEVGSSSERAYISFNTSDNWRTVDENGIVLATNAVFRDVSAWTNFVLTLDSTLATATDRVKLYINGTRYTDFQSSSYFNNGFPSQDIDFDLFTGGQTDKHHIGNIHGGSSYLDGYLAEVCYCDGQTLDASSFGEFDEDSPTIWKPKDVSGLTFGNNGYYLDFEDSSALGNDAAGSNNFGTVTNLAATDQTTDTCTNNFATLNPLKLHSGFSLSEGNTKFSTASGSDKGNVNSTILVNKGKWYAECKIVGGNEKEGIGAIGEDELPEKHFGDGTQNILFNTDIPAIFINSSQTNVTGVTPANNDIVGMALDLDNGRAYFHVNGTYINSGDVAGESGYYSFTVGSTYWGIGSADGSTLTGSAEMNYGNPAFSISSGNSDGNGYGNFEYAPPSNYYALCTKNLAEYG